MIVVDASAAVAALLHDGDARLQLSENRLAAPHLVDAEVLQTMRKLLHRGTMTSHDAEQAIHLWTRLGVERFPITGLSTRIWSLRNNISAYDASYIALAEALNCSLLTADARLSTAPGPNCPITVLPR
ncbi:MAG: type II toxin-antitoxin system VapC family toxin [Acidimicrobiaceae bacterium]|nr:type II toxin-antitoxin system VapC family toxin [Acidimicrobiaceae bacterium]MXW74855.1 type II toxin-antitoxin system VapC family toxin [Acidimicrobiaceae bacterium]MYA73508.1 type II toxin-antitoxin system VapC family toxin [Acidimicrobiaceae bacterium]MYC41058.1 type II toxin-antitoxin system VapC family toxin [Acidimicrobiaceae bacterium]MYD07803.1 type II toxin-antitoxin system VapC family toxin [Acidimicrobiaceae bacterium]